MLVQTQLQKSTLLCKRSRRCCYRYRRSDYPNHVNNVLAFPGIFRGALDVHATKINEEMKLAAAYAIANLVSAEELNAEYVIPSPFDPRVAPAVASGVAKAAIDTGVAQKTDVTRNRLQSTPVSW